MSNNEKDKIRISAEFSAIRDPKDLAERYAELQTKYNELIMAVANKFPDETRHETALRYIKQAENKENQPECGSS